MNAGVTIRAAVPGDTPQIATFIRDLARYERLEHELDLDEARLAQHLFGPAPVCAALLAERGGLPVGFALFFPSYSTFLTAPCLYLEDLFVAPEHRGHGIGLGLLRAVAAAAVERGCRRLDWAVLDWNTPAIEFYVRQGARPMSDWRICRLDGDALQRVAAAAR